MYVFTDCNVSAQALHTLKSFGHAPIPCPPHALLDKAIASHPDMLLFPTESKIFVHTDFHFLPAEFPAVPIVQAPRPKYPYDVLLNAARIGSLLVCRPDATAGEILQYAKDNGLTVLAVRQGYAKCNLCAVSDQAAITEDVSITNALRNAGIDVLQIPPGHVRLPGYNYGFIGGASGTDGENVFFCGDLALHPSGRQISDFCQKHGKRAVSLADHVLHDVGSLLFYAKK